LKDGPEMSRICNLAAWAPGSPLLRSANTLWELSRSWWRQFSGHFEMITAPVMLAAAKESTAGTSYVMGKWRLP
jgi:hypothetical protein